MTPDNSIATIWSHTVFYNSVRHIATLYSGLLQEKVVNRTCVDENGTFSIPEIPDELKECVVNIDLSANNLLRVFHFRIINPNKAERTTRVKAPFKGEPCQLLSNGQTDGAEILDEVQLAIIISSGGFVNNHLFFL